MNHKVTPEAILPRVVAIIILVYAVWSSSEAAVSVAAYIRAINPVINQIMAFFAVVLAGSVHAMASIYPIRAILTASSIQFIYTIFAVMWIWDSNQLDSANRFVDAVVTSRPLGIAGFGTHLTVTFCILIFVWLLWYRQQEMVAIAGVLADS